MFSFHKPKVYRSSTGCCICKAKSSSSRFTDSKKYEEDFIKCFQLEERRTGEICNACVLLVKRWKKLPAGSCRNWRHVVDARAGPGIKSLTKFKAKNKKKSKETVDKLEKALKKKFVKSNGDREDSPAMSDESENLNGNGSKNSSRACSPASSEENGLVEKKIEMDQEAINVSDFIDLTYFKRKNVCCGIIFIGMYGEVLIEPTFYKPCLSCLNRQQQQRQRQQQQRASSVVTTASSSSPAHSSTSSASASPSHSSASASPAHESVASTEPGKPGKAFSDSSSDSGYDDSSNPGENKKLSLSQQQPPPPPAPPSQAALVLQLLGKPGKPATKSQLPVKSAPVASSGAAALRLKSLTGGTKVPIKLLCKPVALVSSAKLSLAGAGPVSADSVLTVVPPSVEFAVRPSPQRPSLAN